MTEKVIKIVPIDHLFNIGWLLTNKCNYDCMYCPEKYHSGTKQFSFEQLKQYWIDIFQKTKSQNLKYKLVFSGGEVTINKSFILFVQWLKENYSDYIKMILVTTNGSASVKYYKKLFKLVDNISFSFHSEHADEKEFFNKVLELKTTIDPKNFIHVNVMKEFWNEDRIPLYTEFLEKHNVSYSVNEVHHSMGTRTFPIMKGKTNFEI